jgi:hypothetical protein
MVGPFPPRQLIVIVNTSKPAGYMRRAWLMDRSGNTVGNHELFLRGHKGACLYMRRVSRGVEERINSIYKVALKA